MKANSDQSFKADILADIDRLKHCLWRGNQEVEMMRILVEMETWIQAPRRDEKLLAAGIKARPLLNELREPDLSSSG